MSGGEEEIKILSRSEIIESTWEKSFMGVEGLLAQTGKNLKEILSELSKVERSVDLEAGARSGKLLLRSFNKCLQHIEQDADEQDNNSDRNKVLDLVKRQKDIAVSMRKDLDQAVLATRNMLIERRKRDRQSLLGSGETRRDIRNSREQVEAKSRDLIAALRQTRTMIADGVKQADDANEIIETSTSTLTGARSEYNQYGEKLGKGKGLISKLANRERIDRIMLIASFGAFLIAVLYIVNKRVPASLSPIEWVLWVFGKVREAIVANMVSFKNEQNEL